MRPATTLAVLFTVLSTVTFGLGILDVFENAPGVWPDAWGTLVVVHAALAVLLGYYVARTN